MIEGCFRVNESIASVFTGVQCFMFIGFLVTDEVEVLWAR